MNHGDTENTGADSLRIAHISDLHFWHITLNPLRLMNKRILGMGNLILNRAWKYRMETTPSLVRHIEELRPDHLLITGDLTTTALEEEFRAVREALKPLLRGPASATVIPGNHDRYTREATRNGLFEKYFAEFAPSGTYPWLKRIGNGDAILGLDPCRPTRFISARGMISTQQLQKASELLDEAQPTIRRLLVACHYPVALPPGTQESPSHGLSGSENLRRFLDLQRPILYCHGHIHTAWAFSPEYPSRTLCLDPGPALRKRKRSGVNASMLEIVLDEDDVEVRRHKLRNNIWEVTTLTHARNFFGDGFRS